MPLPLTVSCFSKIRIGLPFWYWLTRVVLDKGPLNGCVWLYLYTPQYLHTCNQLLMVFISNVAYLGIGLSMLME